LKRLLAEMKVKEFGSEYDFRSNTAFLTSGDCGFVKADWQLYRSGRDAIKAFARLAGKKKALLPALCCESMIIPFEQNGYTVDFYRMNEDLSCNEADVLRKLDGDSVLLYMSYYGIPAFSAEFLLALRERFAAALFLEDRTHDILMPAFEEAFQPDGVIASLRKWAALPDGGMLKTALGTGEAASDSRYAALRLAAMQKKSRYLDDFDAELKKACYDEFNTAAEILDESPVPVKMGVEEEKLLRSIDFEKLTARRVGNSLLFKDLLRPLAESGKLRFVTDKPERSTLYFPIYIENNREVQAELAKQGVYSAVLWPIPSQAEALCPVTEYVESHILGIPCDQRCDENDVRFMVQTLTNILTEK